MMNVWKNTMNPNIFNPPPNAKYIKSIYVDSKVNIGGLIGQKGVVFNAITKASIGMMYIWYNNESRMVEYEVLIEVDCKVVVVGLGVVVKDGAIEVEVEVKVIVVELEVVECEVVVEDECEVVVVGFVVVVEDCVIKLEV